MESKTILLWPAELPPKLALLQQTLDELLLGSVDAQTELPRLSSRHNNVAAPSALVVVVDPGLANYVGQADHALTVIAGLHEHPAMHIVAVVGDGYLGTESAHIERSMVSAAAVAAVRSLAMTRGRSGRSNVVCVPDTMFDFPASQRQPLTQPTEMVDVAHAISYFLGESGDYVSGQVLFVNGGRHLFSSYSA